MLTRQLALAHRFEVSFWRSAFCMLFVFVTLAAAGGRVALVSLCKPGRTMLASGVLWSVMFSCFMLALTFTSTSNTLVMSSATPLLTALLAWLVLREKIAVFTWFAIMLAALGMAWIFVGGVAAGSAQDLLGMAIAFAVPLAAALNVTLLKRSGHKIDLVPTVFYGASFSALAMLPFAWPFHASTHDLIILIVLGFFQLGLPCMLMVVAARSLSAAQIALLALLEVLLGPLWAWLWAGETPGVATLEGGLVVVIALIMNESFEL